MTNYREVLRLRAADRHPEIYHAQTAGLFRLLYAIFPCNTQSIPAEK